MGKIRNFMAYYYQGRPDSRVERSSKARVSVRDFGSKRSREECCQLLRFKSRVWVCGLGSYGNIILASFRRDITEPHDIPIEHGISPICNNSSFRELNEAEKGE